MALDANLESPTGTKPGPSTALCYEGYPTGEPRQALEFELEEDSEEDYEEGTL
jgi:hypothetical protein